MPRESLCLEPVEDMGFGLELRNSAKELNKSAIEENVVQPQTSRRGKHLEKVKLRTGVGVPQNGSASSQEKSLGNRHSLGMKGNAAKGDELVKHMSNLPGYLQRPERGEDLPEKAFNFGVLDWSRLENWKHKQKYAPEKGSNSLPSSSRVSAAERTSGSSTSDVVRTGTNAEQRYSRRSTLNSSQRDGLSQGVKPSGQADVRFQDSITPSKSAARFQDSITPSKSIIHRPKKVPFPYRSHGRNHPDTMLVKGKDKDADLKIITSEKRSTAANSKSNGVSRGQKEDVSTWDGQAKKTKDLLQESDIKRKNIDQRIISDMRAQSSKLVSSDVSLSSKGMTIACNGKTEMKLEELHKSDVNLAREHCPVKESTMVLSPPKESPQNAFPQVLQPSEPRVSWDDCMTEASFSGEFSTKEMDFAEVCSEVPHSCPLLPVVETNAASHMMPNSSRPNEAQELLYEDKFIEKNNSEKQLTSSSSDTSKTSYRADLELATTKGRDPTPNRHRFSFSLGRLGRSFSFKDSPDVPHSSSNYVTVKSGPVSSGTSDYPENPYREKASNHNRARSSPLRRLLDPILKHKEANAHHSAEAVRPVKPNYPSIIHRPINATDSLPKVSGEASWVQAVFQLTFKNGLPLFKLYNNSNCLAAAVNNLSSGKEVLGQSFTFYSVNEIKRKSGGWMSQGNKGKSGRYVYNVVGHMKVSIPDFSDVNEQNSSKHIVRQSVLFGVELRQGDQGSPQFVPKRELAAAVVKIPIKDLGYTEHQNDEDGNDKGCTTYSPEDRCSYSWEDSTIAIIPAGVHSLPNKGEPSPLIDRWKSGGSCDCGGWDVGCKLRVLSNENKCCQNSKTSTYIPFADNFQLFAEEEAQQNRSVFSLAPVKDGSYAIEFNTSLSLLQAFFICVVVLSSRKPADLSEAKVFQEPNLDDGNGVQATGPAKYARNPPLSPVGRV